MERVGVVRRARGLAVAVLLLAASLGAAGPAPAEESVAVVATMSPGREGASAVWTATYVFVFGGFGSPGSHLRDILRFDPDGAQLSLMPSQLPANVTKTSAVWTGERAYIFGGSVPGGVYTDDIVRYDPATDTVTLMGASLPHAQAPTSAVWSGQYAYVFGRDAESGYEIVRYDPAADEVQVMGAKPEGIATASAVWAGGAAYLFGGGNGTLSDQVLKYDPGNDTATVVAHLPIAVAASSAVLADGRAYIFGGQVCYDPGCNTDAIQRFDPATNETVELTARLPSVRLQTAAAWDGIAAHVFGGCCNGANEVVQFDPDGGVPPSAPRILTATSGPGAGQISLAWQRPDDDGGMRLTEYRVYRALAEGGSYASIGTARSPAFSDNGVPSNATRFYKVSAVNLAGEGPFSTEASATAPFVSPPGAPRNLTASAGPGAGQIRLTWQAPASEGGAPVTGHKVYRAASAGGPYSLVTALGVDSTFTDGGLGNGVTRFYRVTAVNLGGEGDRSNEASATTYRLPGAPRELSGKAGLGLRLTGTTLGLQVILQWQAPADDGGTPITAYRVYWSTSPAGPGSLACSTTEGTTCSHSGADPLKANYYWVSAVNLVGEGGFSARACAMTYPWSVSPGLSLPGAGCQA